MENNNGMTRKQINRETNEQKKNMQLKDIRIDRQTDERKKKEKEIETKKNKSPNAFYTHTHICIIFH